MIRLRARPLVLGAVLTALVAAAAVPSTSGAFIAKVPTSSSSAATNGAWTCADAVAQEAPDALLSYAFAETDAQATAGTAVDGTRSGRDGTYVGDPKKSVATGICYRDGGFPYVLSGVATRSAPLGYVRTPSLTVRGAFTLETWFSTSTSTASGRARKCGFLFGSGEADPAASRPAGDAVGLYLTDDGRLVLALGGGAATVFAAGADYADGYWYHVAATWQTTGEASLYVNGRLVGTARSSSGAPTAAGAWRIGYEPPAGWPSAPSSGLFSGSLRFAAMYSTALSATAIARHAAAGSGARPGGDLPNYRG